LAYSYSVLYDIMVTTHSDDVTRVMQPEQGNRKMYTLSGKFSNKSKVI